MEERKVDNDYRNGAKNFFNFNDRVNRNGFNADAGNRGSGTYKNAAQGYTLRYCGGNRKHGGYGQKGVKIVDG